MPEAQGVFLQHVRGAIHQTALWRRMLFPSRDIRPRDMPSPDRLRGQLPHAAAVSAGCAVLLCIQPIRTGM